jgi:hypothetical protein
VSLLIVLRFVAWSSFVGELTCIVDSSIYQDVPLHSLDEFKELAPEAARTSEVLADEHQLMLNRLSFELAERQRYVDLLLPASPHAERTHLSRLDQRKRDLIKQKEELLKESKAKAATADNVKSQIDHLIKVRHFHPFTSGMSSMLFNRRRGMSRKRSATSSLR